MSDLMAKVYKCGYESTADTLTGELTELILHLEM